jgi:uncharacterized protein with FMN-binding domain
MDKSTHLLLAMTLAVFGTSIVAGHPKWGTFTGFAILLLAAGLAAGALPIHSRDFLEERTGPSQRISNSLITLSSAAIVSIYAVGYHRTSSAAHRFDARAGQQRTSAEIVSVAPVAPLTAENPGIQTTPPVSAPPNSPVKKNNVRPGAPRKAAPGAPPIEPRYKDGMYLGWGSCPHGDIEASVVIQEGKIASTAITQCLTRYSCSWIAPKIPGGYPDLPGQVVERQSPKVDYVSGATESSYAFSDAVAAALSKALE